MKPIAMPVPYFRVSTCGTTFFSMGWLRPAHMGMSASAISLESRPKRLPIVIASIAVTRAQALT